MGPSGAGKSTVSFLGFNSYQCRSLIPPPQFINKAAGLEETDVGHGLGSCTHQIQVVRCLDKQNRQIIFVDTPGFDDTNISDFDILQVVADRLKLT